MAAGKRSPSGTLRCGPGQSTLAGEWDSGRAGRPSPFPEPSAEGI